MSGDPRPRQLAIIGDVFCDLSATGMAGLPQWGGDREVASPIRMLPGGSGLNSAIQLASYQTDPARDAIAPHGAGVHTVLHAALGHDSFCDFLQDQAAAAGVDMRKISVSPEPSPDGDGRVGVQAAPGTGVCMVLSGWVDSAMSKMDRCFVTHYGVVGELRAASLDVEALCAADHVHISGFYNFKNLQEDKCAGLIEVLHACKAAGCTTSVCAQFDSSEVWGGIPELCPLMDIVFVNEDEAAAISGVAMDTVDAAAAVPAARWFNEKGAGLAVVTLGKEGALAMARDGGCWHQSTRVLGMDEIKDATGAGDAFIAGFLMAWLGNGGNAAGALR